ncbi:VWA domain-containing protein [Nakamurella antarctica]|uniref:VWA domain-containing protein n=1 Tax=Nakamurella antarctica TaxID=1902245 RepID=A0A3G8ZLA4_9ACTN|nr:VWA domain-containing protein [Nakamurella antarctica]AZI57990.1 VWA domain-containing protein [Nakamurella antarctica]
MAESAEDISGVGPTSPGRSYSYQRYIDGPDPLAEPRDLRRELERIGRDVMEGASARQALRELLRQGSKHRQGLDDLARRVNAQRRKLQGNHRVDGTLQEVRGLLEQALHQEREALVSQNTDDARFREFQLDALPGDTGSAVKELSNYDFISAEAQQSFDQIQQLLGREMLDQLFAGMKAALEHATPADIDSVRLMLTDLSALLADYAAGTDTPDQFRTFMADHGAHFPEDPSSVSDLVDLLAARAAAAEGMMRSLTADQRAELSQLSQQALGDSSLADSLATLDRQLKNLRPGEKWNGSANFKGHTPMGLGEATRAMEELARLDDLAHQLAQDYPGATLADIDHQSLENALGRGAAQALSDLAELERELLAQGLLQRGPDGTLQLSPKAIRKLGESILRDVAKSVGNRQGERDTRRSGAAGEPTGASRPWAFGDTHAWNVPRTLLNAQLRQAGGDQRTLDVADVEIIETEQRTRAAVVLLVDTSWSMVQDGRWVPMKRTVLALHQLISTRFRSDALQVITFGRSARRIELSELIGLEGAHVQGTNLHHGLLLAGEHLAKHPDAMPVVLVVTDGEPTAHLEGRSGVVFSYPPLSETLTATITELDKLTARRAAITFFALGEDPRLIEFMDSMARRCGGRLVAPDLDGLGAEVLADYLRNRTRT